MGDLFFAIRTFFITLVVVLILQVKIGDFTLEERSMSWVRSSAFVGQLQQMADGAVVVINSGLDKVKVLFSSKASKEFKKADVPGYRELISLERSKEYLVDKAKVAKKVAEDAIEQTVDQQQEIVEDELLEEEEDLGH